MQLCIVGRELQCCPILNDGFAEHSLGMKHLRERFANGQWNIYGAQASDGDNWDNDSPVCGGLLANDILPWCRYFAYIEITAAEPQNLWREYLRISASHDNFALQRIGSPADIYPVFRELFKKTIT